MSDADDQPRPDFDTRDLVVKHDFGDYRVGQRVTDKAAKERLWSERGSADLVPVLREPAAPYYVPTAE